MIVNKSTLTAAYKNFRVIYKETFADTSTQWEQIATLVPSSTKTEEYDWLGDIPSMKEWLDTRQLAKLQAFSYSITNKDWESTIEVDRNDYEDERLGMIKPRIQDLAAEAKRHPDQLVFELLKNGFADTCYDGQYFFDTDHSEGDSGTISNKGTTALAEDGAAYGVARTAMRKFKTSSGRFMNIVPDTLVVPVDLEETGLRLLNSDSIVVAGNTDVNKQSKNIFKGSAKLVVSPYLTDTTDWFLLCTNRPIKPLLLQQRKAPEFVALDNPTDANVFFKKKYYYGVDARYQAGYSLWQLAYGSSVT